MVDYHVWKKPLTKPVVSTSLYFCTSHHIRLLDCQSRCAPSSVTLETLARIEHHERCVAALAFSADGTRLMSVAGDSDHMLALWDWEGDQQVCAADGLLTGLNNLQGNIWKEIPTNEMSDFFLLA